MESTVSTTSFSVLQLNFFFSLATKFGNTKFLWFINTNFSKISLSVQSTYSSDISEKKLLFLSIKSVLLLRLAKKHPLFHVDAFWSCFKKNCFHSKNCLCAFPIFDTSCVNLRDDHIFTILAFGSFAVSSPFVLSSWCRLPNLAESKQPFTFCFVKKRAHFWTRVWMRIRLREASPRRRPPFSFECIWARVYMKVRPRTRKYKIA